MSEGRRMGEDGVVGELSPRLLGVMHRGVHSHKSIGGRAEPHVDFVWVW